MIAISSRLAMANFALYCERANLAPRTTGVANTASDATRISRVSIAEFEFCFHAQPRHHRMPHLYLGRVGGGSTENLDGPY